MSDFQRVAPRSRIAPQVGKTQTVQSTLKAPLLRDGELQGTFVAMQSA